MFIILCFALSRQAVSLLQTTPPTLQPSNKKAETENRTKELAQKQAQEAARLLAEQAAREKVQQNSRPVPSPFSDFEIENGVLEKYKGIGGNVVIPDSVKTIGESAFISCTNLTSVTTPKTLKKYIKKAFGVERKHIKFTFTK